MALRNQPYIPLYVQDFMTDEKLAECSASSTGVYIRIMCLMHKSDEYGTILLKQKDKQNSNQIVNFAYKLLKHLPYSYEIILESLEELINEGVLQINEDKLLQKRMIKDNQLSIVRSEIGSKGGKKTQLAKAKVQPNPEYETDTETENIIKNIDGNIIQNIWQRTFGRVPKIPEIELTVQFIKKFGNDKTYRLFKEASLSNFHSVKTLWNSLDEDGNIKPKQDPKTEGKSIEYNPA